MTRPADQPPLQERSRVALPPDLGQRLPAAQLRWAIAQAGVAALVGLWMPGLPALALGMGLGAAAASRASLLGRLALAIGVALATAGGAWAQVQIDGPRYLLGAGAVMAGGAVAGLLGALLDGIRGQSALQAGLTGALGAALGAWAGVRLSGALDGAISGALIGLFAALCHATRALRWTTLRRPASRDRIEAALPAAYRGPALLAAQLDADVEDRAPDLHTRDGLGEVAAWVIHLQWNLHLLDEDIGRIDLSALDQRLSELEREAADTADAFTRDRKRATIAHLTQLLGHRGALVQERERTAALSGYALAFLEEARAGLALARLGPDDHVPAGLTDVLERLRTFSVEQESQRRGARELSFSLPVGAR